MGTGSLTVQLSNLNQVFRVYFELFSSARCNQSSFESYLGHLSLFLFMFGVCWGSASALLNT